MAHCSRGLRRVKGTGTRWQRCVGAAPHLLRLSRGVEAGGATSRRLGAQQCLTGTWPAVAERGLGRRGGARGEKGLYFSHEISVSG
jgi:hypothetical protein